MSWDDFFYPHRVLVRDPLGAAGFGQSWAPARELPAEVKDTQSVVRAADGAERASSTQVTVDLSAAVALEALVTVWKGTPREREARVIAVGTSDNTDSPLDSFLLLYLE